MEKEIQDAEISKARKIDAKLEVINREIRQRSLVKMLTLFVAVGLLIYTIVSSLPSSYNLLYYFLGAISFVIIVTILSWDTFFEWDKEREIAKSTIRLDIQNEDILSLQGKCHELDRKYGELLKEQQKTNEYLQSLKKEPKQENIKKT